MKKIDIKKIGVPNICFSQTSDDDKRDKKFSKQRIERGFDDSELWSLDITIAMFISPRLKRYKEMVKDIGYPSGLKNSKEWNDILNKMIIAFDLIIKLNCSNGTKKEEKDIEVGLDLFRKYYFWLWN